MPEDLMRYDQLAQNALRGVVRDALRKIEKTGLPGEHHFFIQFNTRYPGVSIGERLSQKYPREMTVVLQHQFYNLVVTEDRFQVELSFDNIPEKLVVPYASIKGFLDPAVQFGLQFEVESKDEEGIAPKLTGQKAGIAPKRKPDPKSDGDPTFTPPDRADAPAVQLLADSEETEKPNVVSLDAFRKK